MKMLPYILAVVCVMIAVVYFTLLRESLPTFLPWLLGLTGGVYGAVAAACGAIFVVLTAQLHRSRGVNQSAAHRLFAFSILYLFLLFSSLLASSTSPSAMTASARAAAAVEPLRANFPISQLQMTRGPFRVNAGGV